MGPGTSMRGSKSTEHPVRSVASWVCIFIGAISYNNIKLNNKSNPNTVNNTPDSDKFLRLYKQIS